MHNLIHPKTVLLLCKTLAIVFIFILISSFTNECFSQGQQGARTIEEDMERSKKSIDMILDFSSTGLGHGDDFITEMKNSFDWEFVSKEISRAGIPYQIWRFNEANLNLYFYFDKVGYDAKIIAISSVRKAMPVELLSVYPYLDSKSTYRKVARALYKMLYHSNELMGHRTSLGDFTNKDVYFSVSILPINKDNQIATTVMYLNNNEIAAPVEYEIFMDKIK